MPGTDVPGTDVPGTDVADSPPQVASAPPGNAAHRRPGMGALGWIILTLVVVGFVVAAVTAAFIAGRGARAVDQAGETIEQVTGEGPFTRVQQVDVQSIKNLSELTTIEYVEFTRIEKGDDRGWLNWIDGDRIELFAVARIGAGVDLSVLDDGDVFSDAESGRARITLPPAAITYVDVDNEATHVYNRDTGILTKGDPDLERSARLAAEEVLVTTATERGILDDASERAIVVIEDLLTSLGYTDVEVVAG